MAMTAEEQAALDAAKAEAEQLKKDIEALKKTPPAPKHDDDPSTIEAARKKAKEDEDNKAKEKRIADAARFSVAIKDAIDKGEGFFPSEASKVLEINSSAKFDSELEKADDLRSSLIESVFSIKKNLELLTPSAQERVNAYLQLTVGKRREKAAEYWEYVVTAQDIFNRMEALERVSSSRAGMSSSAPWQKEHEGKLFGLNQKKEGK